MHALAQQVDAHCDPNIVVQEVVRGYRWQDRVLREAQVIVAVAPEET
jgi:molecular chaperone GrpE